MSLTLGTVNTALRDATFSLQQISERTASYFLYSTSVDTQMHRKLSSSILEFYIKYKVYNLYQITLTDSVLKRLLVSVFS